MQWSEPIGTAILGAVLAIAPFVSTDLVGILLTLCFAFFGLITLCDPSRFGLTPVHLPVLLYWLVSSLAVASSPVPDYALKGWFKLTLYLGFFLLAARVLRSPRLRSWLITLMLLVGLITGVYGIQQSIVGVEELATWTDPTSASADTSRIYSYLGNPNLFAGYLIPSVAFSAAAFLNWTRWLPKLLAIVIFAVNAIALVLTFSRGGWIGLVASGFVSTLLWVWWNRDRLPAQLQRWALPGIVGLSAAVVLFAIAVIEPIRLRVFSMFSGRGDSSNNFRINVWMAVLDMIRDHPLTGIGPGNSAFNKIYPLYMRPKFSALSSYSILLEVTVEAGVIGLLSFLWLLLVTVTQAVTQMKRLRSQANLDGYWLIAAIATVIGLMGHGLVDTVFYRPPIQTLWWLVLAIVASFYQPIVKQES